MAKGKTKGKKNTPVPGPGMRRVEAARKRQREAVASVVEQARANEEAFWEETGASHYREAEALARRLHGGR
jgi:hypothetical protein